MFSYIRGTVLLFRTYLELLTVLHSLPKWMQNPDDLEEMLDEHTKVSRRRHADGYPSEPLVYRISYVPRRAYRDRLDEMREELRRLHKDEREVFSYQTRLMLIFIIRAFCIYTACIGDLRATLLISSLQFLIAPYSLFVALTQAIGLIPPIYAAHYITFLILRTTPLLVARLLPEALVAMVSGVVEPVLPWLYVPIGPLFVAMFFVVEMSLCGYIYVYATDVRYSTRDTLKHVVWGFMNTKTYAVVLLLLCMNSSVTIPIWVWIIDAKFKITPQLAAAIQSKTSHWNVLFFIQHHMAHLPKVYEHAHKLHHFLHGTISFDAHIYGSGLPEEFFFLVLESYLACGAQRVPGMLNPYVLMVSYLNKYAHTMYPGDGRGENWHAYHHTLHVKNFGIYNSLIDMYLGTAKENDKYFVTIGCEPGAYGSDDCALYVIRRTDEDDETVFSFTLQCD